MNTWWLGHLQDDNDVVNIVNDLTQVGRLKKEAYLMTDKYQTQLKVARTWGFGSTNDSTSTTGVYYQLLNSTGQYFNFDPNTGESCINLANQALTYSGARHSPSRFRCVNGRI